ncbi:MAG: helix-turn-helix transcriptional regulator [Oscillospiraceae bacterium]|nr:helix-turn-helix transcriptional regulator [Oscillospiraceae bacterium]
MKLSEKLEYLLTRKRISKTEFAKSVGITYRAFNYYITENRRPRKDILKRMADELGVTAEFLSDDNADLELSADEKFIKTLLDSGKTSAGAIKFLEESKGLFAGNSISDEDKEFLIRTLNEIYLDSRKNNKNGE